MEWQGVNQLYGQYRRELFAYLSTLCGDRNLAEDLLQETFVKAFFSLSPHHTNVRAWLYLVARNLYFDQCRTSRRLCGEASDSQMDHSPGPEERVLWDERDQALHQALNRLEERKREILTMQYFGGLSHKEIGRILKIRPDYVRVLGCRGKKELKQWMEEAGYELP